MPDYPDLARAIAVVLTQALETAEDHWVRAEFPLDWPVEDALAGLCGSIQRLRVGLLWPRRKADFGGLSCTISDSPVEMTRSWRNVSADERRDNPTILVGDARGRDEAGLRSLRVVVRESDVFKWWQGQIVSWLSSNIASETPRPLIQALFRLAEGGVVDSRRLDDYLGEALAEPGEALARLRSELWRLNLLPDERALDVGRAGDRLQLNLLARRLLTTSPDRQADEFKLARLYAAAVAGDAIAEQAVRYRESGEIADLTGMQLDAVWSLVQPTSKPSPKAPPRVADLLDLLDDPVAQAQDAVLQLLETLAAQWDFESIEAVQLEGTLSIDDATSLEVAISADPVDLEQSPGWANGRDYQTQPLAVEADSMEPRTWFPFPAGRAVDGTRLLENARAYDLAAGTSLEGAALAYLLARVNLGPYEPWLLPSNALTLLLVSSDARQFVREYLAAWSELTEVVAIAQGQNAGGLRQTLLLLEAVWGSESSATGVDYRWCVLGPFHPYVLTPLLRLADYALQSLGAPDLGKKIRWALDHSLPAYPALWISSQTTLVLSHTGDYFEFNVDPHALRPQAASGDGLGAIASSFVGFHPFAGRGLTLTLVNPPRGGAVNRSIRQMSKRMERTGGRLSVFALATASESADLEELPEHIRHLGRFQSIADWIKQVPIRAHVLVVFLDRSAGGSVAAGSGGPIPGAHVAPQIRIEPASPFSNSARQSVYVTFEPRANNGPVVAAQRLAAPEQGAPRLFTVRAILGDETELDFEALAELADWVVLAAPSPLGLVAPKNLPAGLEYIGRESLGPYALFVYATSMFSIRRFVTSQLSKTPTTPSSAAVEERLAQLATESANGVLRMARVSENGAWEHVGVIMAGAAARGWVDDD